MDQNELFNPVEPVAMMVNLVDIRPPDDDGSKGKIAKGVTVLGMVSSLTLRKLSDDTFEIIDGRRRYR